MRRAAGLVAILGLVAAMGGSCHTAPRIFAPPPPLRAASVAPFAVDVEFDIPVDRTSAEDATRYQLYPAGDPAAAVTVTSATVVDTVFGRTVQLLVPAWVGAAPDSVMFEITATGVRAANGRPAGNRTASFRTGLFWSSPLRQLFDGHCNFCHGGARAGGNYRTDSYAALFGPGTNPTPNLIASDPRCLLVTKCKPRSSMFVDGQLTYLDFDILVNWVVNYAARP